MKCWSCECLLEMSEGHCRVVVSVVSGTWVKGVVVVFAVPILYKMRVSSSLAVFDAM